MLLRMTSYEEWTFWFVSFGALFPLAVLLAACVCCRKRTPKNDLLGLAGMVTITNPEGNTDCSQEESDGPRSSFLVSDGTAVSSEQIQPNIRQATTVNRSLPDIPIYSGRVCLQDGSTLWENEVNGDTSCELYATVEENKHSSEPLVNNVPLQGLSAVTQKQEMFRDEQKSSEQSSPSQTDDNFPPYSQLKSNNPYDIVKKNENPYAHLGSSGHSENKTTTRVDEDAASCSVVSRTLSSQAVCEPVAPPRARRPTSQGSPAPDEDTTMHDIPAATAIAGRVSASQELPYMTPPIVDPQANFSGDSQDSKGYTSISVREPLVNIKAQTQVTGGRNSVREKTDPHYTTMSDDSDEMYAAIEDPNQMVYTSGSETYAQIQPVASLLLLPAAVESEDTQYSAPQPPSVDSLKHVAQAHSRQASSSSATSSVANVGSPKPEKRQANSPLPPPPAGGGPELHGGGDQKSDGHLDVTGAKNLEEMYAKVMKKKRVRVTSEGEQTFDENFLSNLVQPCLERLSMASVDQRVDETSSISLDSRDSECQSLRETKQVDADSTGSSNHDFSQESRLMFDLNVQQNVQSISSLEALYSSSGSASHLVDARYESLVQPHSIMYCDPGYERVCRQPSEGDPNYEELHPCDEGTHLNCGKPGYISITKQELTSVDCVHPSVPDVASDEFYDSVKTSPFPGYERVCSHLKPETEPDYASLRKKRSPNPCDLGDGDSDDCGDPNYESVSSELQDPNYELLNHEDPNYESVNYSVNTAFGEPPYEILSNEARDSDNDTSVTEYRGTDAGSVDMLNQLHTQNQYSGHIDNTKCLTEFSYEEVGKEKHQINS